ncbi:MULTISPECIES: efflux transporter outer membrane subunit [Pseudomonadota]|uniref:efflux transporter outer membrane subunit n=1 Tax=Pseudomonadota TaxID=1224 RepID=UPI0008263358|nr:MULTISPECIES: efflux transporter outer membrane subunit [Pseudomonadota]MAF60306.1 multidrug transporter [Blastomonas sp.]
MSRWSLAAVSMLCVSGCSTIGMAPEGNREIVAPAEFHFAPAGTLAVSRELSALLPVEDPAFQSLLVRAEQAPNLELALARIDAARAVTARAKAERKPDIGLGASARGVKTNPNRFGTFPAGISLDATQLELGGQISARWDPDIFGGLRNAELAAQHRLDAAGFEAQAVRIAIKAEVAAAVVDWQNMRDQQAVFASSIASAEDRAQLIASRVRAGISPGFDSLRAEALVESLKAQLSALEGEQAAIVARMVALTGAPAELVLEDLNKSPGTWRSRTSVSAVPSTVLAARPDIQAAAARLAATDADLAAVAAQRFPRFTLSSALGLLSLSFGGLFSNDAIVGLLGGEVAGPLLDFGRVEAEIDESRAQGRIAFAELRRDTFAALGETEEAFGRLSSADAEARMLRQQAERDADVASLAATRYRSGLENFIVVLDADRNAYAARQAAIASEARAARARLVLWQSLGGPTG